MKNSFKRLSPVLRSNFLPRPLILHSILGALLLVGVGLSTSGCTEGCNSGNCPPANPPPINNDACSEGYNADLPYVLPTGVHCADICQRNLDDCYRCAGRTTNEGREEAKCRERLQPLDPRERGNMPDAFVAPDLNSTPLNGNSGAGDIIVDTPLGMFDLIPDEVLIAVEAHGLTMYLVNFDKWLSPYKRTKIIEALSSMTPEQRGLWSQIAINSLPYFEISLNTKLQTWGWSPSNQQHVNTLLYLWFNHWLSLV